MKMKKILMAAVVLAVAGGYSVASAGSISISPTMSTSGYSEYLVEFFCDQTRIYPATGLPATIPTTSCGGGGRLTAKFLGIAAGQLSLLDQIPIPDTTKNYTWDGTNLTCTNCTTCKPSTSAVATTCTCTTPSSVSPSGTSSLVPTNGYCCPSEYTASSSGCTAPLSITVQNMAKGGYGLVYVTCASGTKIYMNPSTGYSKTTSGYSSNGGLAPYGYSESNYPLASKAIFTIPSSCSQPSLVVEGAASSQYNKNTGTSSCSNKEIAGNSTHWYSGAATITQTTIPLPGSTSTTLNLNLNTTAGCANLTQ